MSLKEYIEVWLEDHATITVRELEVFAGCTRGGASVALHNSNLSSVVVNGERVWMKQGQPLPSEWQ